MRLYRQFWTSSLNAIFLGWQSIENDDALLEDRIINMIGIFDKSFGIPSIVWGPIPDHPIHFTSKNPNQIEILEDIFFVPQLSFPEAILVFK